MFGNLNVESSSKTSTQKEEKNRTWLDHWPKVAFGPIDVALTSDGGSPDAIWPQIAPFWNSPASTFTSIIPSLIKLTSSGVLYLPEVLVVYHLLYSLQRYDWVLSILCRFWPWRCNNDIAVLSCTSVMYMWSCYFGQTGDIKPIRYLYRFHVWNLAKPVAVDCVGGTSSLPDRLVENVSPV